MKDEPDLHYLKEYDFLMWHLALKLEQKGLPFNKNKYYRHVPHGLKGLIHLTTIINDYNQKYYGLIQTRKHKKSSRIHILTDGEVG
jgi:hypothetical protein